MVDDESDEGKPQILYCYNCDLPVETVLAAMIQGKFSREVCSPECKKDAERLS